MAAHRHQPTCYSTLIRLALMASAVSMWAMTARAMPPHLPGSTEIHMVAGTGAPAASPLGEQQLAKIQKFIDAKHREGVIAPEMAQALGLGAGGKPVKVLQVALVDKDKKTRHIFDRLQDGSGFLVGKRNAEGFALYRLDHALNSIASVLWRKDGNKVALRSTDAASGLRQELEIWARFADTQK